MTEFRCERMVKTDDWHYPEKCGRPAKYVLEGWGGHTVYLCGIHARRYIMAQKPWHKITELKKTVNVTPK